MDKKLTDSEIVKALECCGALDKGCQKCLYNETFGSICIHFLCKDALDLINRLQAEKEVLKARIGVYETCNARKDEANRHLEAENERLTIRLRKVEHQLDDLCKMHHIIKTEAYKEFAERLKEDAAYYSNSDGAEWFSVDVADIDNLLKELVGEDK